MDVVYFLRSILQENTSFYILKSAEKQAKGVKKSLRGVKLTNILHE